MCKIFANHSNRIISLCLMNENEYIIICLKQIEDTLQWDDSKEWTDYEFKKLSDAINKKTGTVISTHTLKRLYGKITYKPRHNPQIATKNALAMFLDYQDWESFISKNKDKAFDTAKYDKFGKKPAQVWLFVLITIIIITIAGVIYFYKKNQNGRQFDFRVENKEGKAPHTITYHYDVSNIKQTVKIDYGFRHPDYLKDWKKVDKNRHVLNYTYQVPGYYCTKLLIDDIPVDSADILVRSDEWISFILAEGETPRFWLDNMVDNLNYAGTLTLTPQQVITYGGDTNKVYYTLHRYIKPLGIGGDHCQILLRFKNGPENGGITCYDSDFRFIGKNTTAFVRFMEKNCHRFSGVKFGNVVKNGEYDDLSEFGRELDQWNDLNISIRNNHASVLFNGHKIHTCEYKQNIGELIGLEFRFKGSGQMAFIEIKDDQGHLFRDDFN